MARVTIKVLQEEIETLKAINTYQKDQIKKLEAEIESFKNKGELVSKSEFDFLNKQIEDYKFIANEYEKMYETLRGKYKKERDKNIVITKIFTDKLESLEIKKNERNAGRKAYNNKDVIEVIYYLYLDGRSLQEVTDELNSTEVRTNRGKKWAKSTIRFLLLNSKNVDNGFISQDIFERTVRLMHSNKK